MYVAILHEMVVVKQATSELLHLALLAVPENQNWVVLHSVRKIENFSAYQGCREQAKVRHPFGYKCVQRQQTTSNSSNALHACPRLLYAAAYDGRACTQCGA